MADEQHELARIAEHLEGIRGSLSTLATVAAVLAFPILVGFVFGIGVALVELFGND